MKIGFVGLGIMGHPMALNLIKGGHELFVFGKRRLPADVREAGATVCDTLKAIAEQAEIVIMMVPDTPGREERAVRSRRYRRGAVAGQDRRRHELDLADRDQAVRRRDQQKRLRLCRRAGVGRRGRRQGGLADDHGRRLGSRLRQGQAAVRADGQEHHARRRGRRRADHQGRQPDHRRADDRGGRRSAAVRVARPAPTRPRCGRR